MLFELINPSDAYTFEAPSIEIAGAAVALLSPSFGARCLDGASNESTPVLFGWNEWLADRGIDADYVLAHKAEIAAALDSMLIGDVRHRRDIEDLLARLPEDEREAARAERQNRHRTSMNRIGEAAYALAKQLRESVEGAS